MTQTVKSDGGGRGNAAQKRSMDAILGALRQMRFPPEFRIAAPPLPDHKATESPKPATGADPTPPQPDRPPATESSQLAAEFANCLWYLKTKYFRRGWEDLENSDDDPRVRRALGRINRTIDTLRENGLELQDPTDRRYPPGGEAMMRPIQFVPTPGLTVERVAETVSPIIFQNDRLIRRGEVFVAVPPAPTDSSSQSGREANGAGSEPVSEDPDNSDN